MQVDTEGPLSLGEGSRNVQLNADAKTTLSFPLSAREGHSVAKVRVRVDGNGFKADRRYDLPVRAAWPQVIRSQVRTLDPLAAVSLDGSLLDGLMPESVTARLLVSPLPPIRRFWPSWHIMSGRNFMLALFLPNRRQQSMPVSYKVWH